MIVPILFLLFQVGLSMASPTPSSIVVLDDFSTMTTTIFITPTVAVIFKTRTEYATAAAVSQVCQFEAEHSDKEPDESNVPISRSVTIAIAVVLLLLIMVLGLYSCIWAGSFWRKLLQFRSNSFNHAQQGSTSSALRGPDFQRTHTRVNGSSSLSESENHFYLPPYTPPDVPPYERRSHSYPPVCPLPQVPSPTYQV